MYNKNTLKYTYDRLHDDLDYQFAYDEMVVYKATKGRHCSNCEIFLDDKKYKYSIYTLCLLSFSAIIGIFYLSSSIFNSILSITIKISSVYFLTKIFSYYADLKNYRKISVIYQNLSDYVDAMGEEKLNKLYNDNKEELENGLHFKD